MRAYKIKSDWRKTRETDNQIMNTKYVNKPECVVFKKMWDTITYSMGVLSIQFRVFTKHALYNEVIQKKVKYYISNNYSKRNIVIVEQVSNKNDWSWYRISLTIKTSLPTKTDIEKLIDDVSKIILVYDE